MLIQKIRPLQACPVGRGRTQVVLCPESYRKGTMGDPHRASDPHAVHDADVYGNRAFAGTVVEASDK